MATTTKEATGWLGWIYFAGMLMVIMGTLHAIAGLAALLNDKYYLVTSEQLLAFDFTTWGWVHLIFGIVVIVAASSLLNGNFFGRFMGIVLAILSVIVNFSFLSAYPIWSILMIFIGIMTIYALTVHGSEAKM